MVKFTKNQKVWSCLRGDLTSLFFSKVAKYAEVRGDLSSNVGNKKSFTSRASVLLKIMQHVENRFDVLMNRFIILNSTQDLC